MRKKKFKKKAVAHSEMRKKEFRKKAAVFLIKFFLIYAVLQALLFVFPIMPLLEFIAGTEASWLGLQSQGNIVMANSHGFEIAENCSGLVSVSVLAAIVFSLSRPELHRKILLFAAGALFLFPLNLLRVYFVLLAAVKIGPGIAEALHVATWFVTSAAIIAVWYFLTKRISKAKDFSELL